MEENLHIDQHISQKFNRELEELRSKVLTMGGMVERQCSNAVAALIDGDAALSLNCHVSPLGCQRNVQKRMYGATIYLGE